MVGKSEIGGRSFEIQVGGRTIIYIFIHRIGRNMQTENRNETQRKYLTKK